MRSLKHLILIPIVIIFCISCEDYYNRRVVFTLESIVADRTVVGQGESVNISANITITGMVNENNVKYTWDCNQGDFNDRTRQVTTWTAPSNNIGEFLITLKVNFMGNTEEGEIAIKVVRTPAGAWGSISGNILNSVRVPLQNIIVLTKTGERDTTDNAGFFYIEDVPQGTTSLELLNIGYKWAIEPLDGIGISGGIHEHLGDIFIYESKPPVILSYNKIPEYQSIISFEHDYPVIFEHFEIYISYNQEGADSALLAVVAPEASSITIKQERDSAYIAMRAVPFQGNVSDLSEWTKISFAEVIDPDADKSSIEYLNFFNALLTWEPTGYEDYYKGYRIAAENDTGFEFISHLLSASTFQYVIETVPGITKNYFIIAITKSEKYNLNQPADQRISLEVPSMEFPYGFKGKFLISDISTVRLYWEPIAANNVWYSGYLIEKKTVTDTLESGWEELIRIDASLTSSYTDTEVDTSNIYRYKIRTISYPPGLGYPEYSLPDSITVVPF